MRVRGAVIPLLSAVLLFAQGVTGVISGTISEPGTFTLLRKKGSAVLRLATSGSTRNDLLEGSGDFPIEVDWSLDGKNVDVYTKAEQAGWVRLVSPHAEIARLNGKAVATQPDGKFGRISW
jgi:hypothetical protein